MTRALLPHCRKYFNFLLRPIVSMNDAASNEDRVNKTLYRYRGCQVTCLRRDKNPVHCDVRVVSGGMR